MQTVQFLHDAFAQALPTIHARRLEALIAAVVALLQGRRLTLTAPGRSMPGSSFLLLIAVLASYALCLLGLQAREAGHERRFQSNSLKDRHVLSLWRLGLEYVRGYAGGVCLETLCRLILWGSLRTSSASGARAAWLPAGKQADRLRLWE